MAQYVSWKAHGLLATKSWHVLAEAEQDDPHAPPAQSPQKVMSKTYGKEIR